MLRNNLSLFACTAFGASCAWGQNHIQQWNPNIPPSKYTISQVARTIEINEGTTERFKFEAFDLSTGAPARIDAIFIDANGAGQVHIAIAGNPAAGRIDGAARVDSIDLTGALDSRIAVLRITGPLGTVGPIIADAVGQEGIDHIAVGGDLLDGIFTDIADGDIRISGDMPSSGSINITGDVNHDIQVAGVFSGSITIGGDVIDNQNHIWIRHMVGGSISCRNMDLISDDNGGEWLTLGAFAPFDPTLIQSGTITVNGTLKGRIYCRTISDLDITIGTLNADPDNNGGLAGIMSGVGWLATSSITVTGDFVKGAIHYADNVVASTRNLDCDITIMGDMGSATTTARITTVTLINGNPADLDIGGAIHIGGDLTSGALIKAEGDLNGVLDVAGDFGGHLECVDLNGDLFIGDDFNDAGPGDEIEISGVVAGGVNIHVNHQLNIDGRWQNNATMKIGAAVHDNTWTAINNPSVTPDVWVISEYRGDCNNDNEFNSFDIEFFLDILFEPATYLAEHPGLFSANHTPEELMIYHGDSNCDGSVNAFDIDPFTTKLLAGCTGCWCSGKCCDPAGCNFCRIILPGGSRFVARVNLIVGMAHLAVHHMLGGVDPADRIVALFLDHVDSRYYPRLIDVCGELVVEYDRMGDSERSEKWLRVLMALSAR